MSFPLPERGLILLSHPHSRFGRDPFFFPKVARALLPGLSASASALLTFGVGSVAVVGGFPVHRGMFSSAPASNTNCLGCGHHKRLQTWPHGPGACNWETLPSSNLLQ